VARPMNSKHVLRLSLPWNLATLAVIAVIATVVVKFPSVMESGWAAVVIVPLFLGVAIASARSLIRANRKPVVICVTADGLTVDRRPNDVFSFGDAQLGTWSRRYAPPSAALHLRCGGDRFVLGRSERSALSFPAGSLPEAPPVGWTQPDAAMSPSDFDELIAVVVRRRESGLSGH
jgi:hypothetical protein